MPNPRLGKYAMDAILIVFSVLLALTIDKSVEVWQTRKQKAAALEAIHSELARNEKIVRSMYDNHLKILARIEDFESGKNDSLRAKLRDAGHFDLWILTNGKSIAPEFASNTAWETARVTGIMSEFDYSEIEELTRIYAQQHIIFSGTLAGIVDVLFQRETNDIKNFDGTLLQFKVRFKEMVDQERSLLAMYEGREGESGKD